MSQEGRHSPHPASSGAGTESEVDRLRRERDEAVAARESALDMLATFTHELRTPLTGILGVANLLLGTRLNHDQAHYARTIWESGTHLRRLVDDVVELSMLESRGFRLETAPANPAGIVRGVLDIVGPEARKKQIGLSWQITGELDGFFIIDAARFRQVLLNLAANAIRFTDKGSVRIEGDIESSQEGRVLAKFVIADTGMGMSKDVRSSLFTRFTRAGPKDRRGAGLGLAISRQIVELMGGRIEVESEPGRGSRFSILVPLTPTAAEVAVAPPNEIAANSELAVPLDLLIAEDDELNQMYFETLLRAGGHEVTVVGNGREALEAAAGGDFDAILMDIQMPDMDGIAATRAIRALPGGRGRVPVIALTGGVDRKAGNGLAEAGFTSCLTKPLEDGELATALSRATGKPVFIPDYAVGIPEAPSPSPAATEAIEQFVAKAGALRTGTK